MKIAINLWVLRNKNYDGIGLYSINIFKELIAQHPEVHFQLLMPKNYAEDFFDFPNVSYHPIFPALRHPLLYIHYMEVILPLYLKKIKPDVVLSADGLLSLSSSLKQIPIIYDINFVHYPKTLKLKNRLYYNFFFPKFAHKAARIATISTFSKQDIVKSFNVAENKVDLIYGNANIEGIDLTDTEKQEARGKFSNGHPYFFFVGSLIPRKNIQRLILAFDAFKKHHGSDVKLLISGNLFWDMEEISTLIPKMSFKDDIVLTGRVSDDDLKRLMSSSLALCYVSIFEGFGMPILEAMHCKTPVITSNTSSMPEIAGDAAIYVDPLSIESITDAMDTIFKNEGNVREDLISKGMERIKVFSWQRSASLLWDTVAKVGH